MITSSNIKLIFFKMDWLSNIWTLFINCNNDNCSFIIHTDINWIIANLFNSLSGNLFEVDISFCTNFTKYHTDWVLNWTFTCNFRIWILSKTSIKNRVWNVVAKFVRMTTCYIFWCKEKVTGFYLMIHL